MKHWVVKVDTKTYVVEAETPEEADRVAVKKWFDESYISIKHAEQVYCPCQWGEECPANVANCGDCLRKMRVE